jgi:uncharacterized protein
MDWYEYASTARHRGALAFEVYVIMSFISDMSKIDSNRPAHLSFIRDLETRGILMFAGPLSDEQGDEVAGGMIIVRATDYDAARTIAEADPMHVCGGRIFQLRRWLINEGSIKLEVQLSSSKSLFA